MTPSPQSIAAAFNAAADLIEPLGIIVDLATLVALYAILGFRWPLFMALLPEAVPGLSVFPFWLAAVVWVVSSNKNNNR